MNHKASATWNFHRRVYGEDFRYEYFVPMFKAELWDPNRWCDLFAKSGAKYVVTTANYHDGFAMYPTEYAQFNETDRWNSVERGPRRDIIGELNTAGEKRGLKMGIYYSVYEWYHPLWKNPDTRTRYVTEHWHPKFKEVVTKYKPWFIFLDGEWSADHTFWRSAELAAWLYNESPCREYVVVNDRWGKCRGVHGDVYESEYGGGESCSPEHPWQEDRGMGHSYGYNRAEGIEEYDSAIEMIQMLVRCTANGGNYLLCVGPTGDGRIPVIMQERLLQIGEWLGPHGEAIYGAKASPFWPRQFDRGFISAKPGKLYLHLFDPKATSLELTGLKNRVTGARILEHPNETSLKWAQNDETISFEWPIHLNNDAVTVIALDIEGQPDVDKTQQQSADGTVNLGCRLLRIDGKTARVEYGGHGNNACITNWTDSNDAVMAQFDLIKPGQYNLQLTYGTAAKGGSVSVVVGDSRFDHELAHTGGEKRFKTVTVGKVEFGAPGRHQITIKPQSDAWSGIGLRSIRLLPADN